jgi:integrase
MLTIWRRHTAQCPHRDKGRDYLKCNCPIWADGYVNGQRTLRHSLKTRDMARARNRAAALESPDNRVVKPVSDAVTAYENHIWSLQATTQRRYKIVMREFQAFCEGVGLHDIMQVSVEDLDAYRAARKLSPITAAKELVILRQFLGFCFDRRWTEVKPEEVVPYTQAEITKMIVACDGIGNDDYTRLRARAVVLLLRYTGLRISDVATLEPERVRDGQILLHTQKTGGTVFLPVPDELQRALDALPCPRRATKQPRWFLWNGSTSKGALVGIVARTLRAVFKRAGVEGAHAHRFRHTLATEILARGGTEQDCADILGISASVVRKHYAKWSQARQQRITKLFEAVYPGTIWAHNAKAPVIN